MRKLRLRDLIKCTRNTSLKLENSLWVAPKFFLLQHTLDSRMTGKSRNRSHMLAMPLSFCVWGCGEGRWLGSLLVGLHGAVLWKIAFHVLWIYRIRGEHLREPQATTNKAKCRQKVVSLAMALQSDRNTSQTPEVKEHLSEKEETLLVPRD